MLRTDIIKLAANKFCVDHRDLTGPYRFNFLMRPRFAVAKILRERGCSLKGIGLLLNRDHSTVRYQIERAEYFMSRDPKYAAIINELIELKVLTAQVEEEEATA